MGLWSRACVGLLVVVVLCFFPPMSGLSADKKETKEKPSYGKIDAKLQARVDKGEVEVTAGIVSALVPQDAGLIFNVYNAGTNTETGLLLPEDKKHELRIKCVLLAFEQKRPVWVLVEKGEIIAVIVR